GSTPVQVRDKTVSPGEVCVIFTGATNRDAERFAEPDRLDLERENVPHLTFGLGNHVCLGAQLARAELQIALGMLFARLPGLEYSGVAEPELRDSLFLRGLKSLEVSW
ncbi:MAG: cytochrome P450, partial [Myxococcota bacterium]